MAGDHLETAASTGFGGPESPLHRTDDPDVATRHGLRGEDLAWWVPEHDGNDVDTTPRGLGAGRHQEASEVRPALEGAFLR